MYQLVEYKKSKGTDFCNYEFKTFDDFKAMAPVLLVPLTGKFVINIVTEDIRGIQEFIKNESMYQHLVINVYTSAAAIEYITMRDTNAQCREQIKDFEVFKSLISEKNLYLDKGVIHTLYNSVEHSYDEMSKSLDLLVKEYGVHTKITESMLSELFILNKVIYPRQVLLDYLWLSRYRSNRLKKCIATMGNDVVTGALVKNVKALVEEKVTYLKTGKGTNLIKSINTERLQLMYRLLVVERCGVNDAFILLSLYERGLTVYDIVYRKKN